jgi:hypothetical protein
LWHWGHDKRGKIYNWGSSIKHKGKIYNWGNSIKYKGKIYNWGNSIIIREECDQLSKCNRGVRVRGGRVQGSDKKPLIQASNPQLSIESGTPNL